MDQNRCSKQKPAAAGPPVWHLARPLGGTALLLFDCTPAAGGSALKTLSSSHFLCASAWIFSSRSRRAKLCSLVCSRQRSGAARKNTALGALVENTLIYPRCSSCSGGSSDCAHLGGHFFGLLPAEIWFGLAAAAAAALPPSRRQSTGNYEVWRNNWNDADGYFAVGVKTVNSCESRRAKAFVYRLQ